MFQRMALMPSPVSVTTILRRNFEGAEAQISFGQITKHDNNRYTYSAIPGKNFAQDHGNITVAVSLDTNEGVLNLERDYYRQGYLL